MREMKKGTCELQRVRYAYGTVTEMVNKETERYILPSTVRLTYHGEKLYPTQFDSHGNPQISGVSDLILLWKTRQMARDGLIKSDYDMKAEYSYTVTSDNPNIKARDRFPTREICPVCNRYITAEELDGSREVSEDGAKWWESLVEYLDDENVVVHSDCAKEFYRLRMIDMIAERVGLVFDNYEIDKDKRFEWGHGANQMWYELIPNEYCTRRCCAHRPWFMFHTPIGDIKIGWRKRVINITFMENFAPFSMDIFAQENVTKHDEGGRRTIHAWGYEKMFQYLDLVRKTVLPNADESE